MTSTPSITAIYQTHDGELFASKEAAQEYCRDRTYRLGMMGWMERKLRDGKQAPVSTDESPSALVDVPAVESEPVAFGSYYEDKDGQGQFYKSGFERGVSPEDLHELEIAVTKLYAHPPRFMTKQETTTMASVRAQAIEDVLSTLTAHELYRYRPKAFQGFIEYARAALVDEAEGRLWRDEQSQSKGLNAWIDVNDRLPGEQGEDSEEVSVFLNGHCGLLDHAERRGGGWGYRTGFYDAARQCFRVHGMLDQFVTHWQPLPTPPLSTRKGSAGDGSATTMSGNGEA